MKQVLPGDTITDFRGDTCIFIRVSRLPAGPSTGRVLVEDEGREREYYPSVFGNGQIRDGIYYIEEEG